LKRNSFRFDFADAFKNRNGANGQFGIDGGRRALMQQVTNSARRVMFVEVYRVRKVVQQRHADPAAKPDRHQKRAYFLPAILKVHDKIGREYSLSGC